MRDSEFNTNEALALEPVVPSWQKPAIKRPPMVQPWPLMATPSGILVNGKPFGKGPSPWRFFAMACVALLCAFILCGCGGGGCDDDCEPDRKLPVANCQANPNACK